MRPASTFSNIQLSNSRAYIFDSETGAEHPIYLNEKKNEVEATSILYLQKYVD